MQKEKNIISAQGNPDIRVSFSKQDIAQLISFSVLSVINIVVGCVAHTQLLLPISLFSVFVALSTIIIRSMKNDYLLFFILFLQMYASATLPLISFLYLRILKT